MTWGYDMRSLRSPLVFSNVETMKEDRQIAPFKDFPRRITSLVSHWLVTGLFLKATLSGMPRLQRPGLSRPSPGMIPWVAKHGRRSMAAFDIDLWHLWQQIHRSRSKRRFRGAAAGAIETVQQQALVLRRDDHGPVFGVP